MRRVGIFCGTFNPIHIGHLLMAECARDQLELDKVLFITSPNPPHRQVGLLDKEDRHEMVMAAVADNNFFEASRLELDRPGPSYTIETVRALEQLHGDKARLYLIIGQDNLPYLKQWKESREIMRLCTIVVAPRHFPSPNPKYESAQPINPDVSDVEHEILDFPLIPISASSIRARISAGRSVRYMVPAPVYEILMTKGHYREGSGTGMLADRGRHAR